MSNVVLLMNEVNASFCCSCPDLLLFVLLLTNSNNKFCIHSVAASPCYEQFVSISVVQIAITYADLLHCINLFFLSGEVLLSTDVLELWMTGLLLWLVEFPTSEPPLKTQHPDYGPWCHVWAAVPCWKLFGHQGLLLLFLMNFMCSYCKNQDVFHCICCHINQLVVNLHTEIIDVQIWHLCQPRTDPGCWWVMPLLLCAVIMRLGNLVDIIFIVQFNVHKTLI